MNVVMLAHETINVLDAVRARDFHMQRLDGRGIYDYRSLRVIPGSQPGNVEVTLGKTR